MKNLIKKILKEDLEWIDEITPFDFTGAEIWLETNQKEAKIVIEKLKEIGVIQKHAFNYEISDDDFPSNIKYIILHCGMDYNDYKPTEGEFCVVSYSPKEEKQLVGEYIELKKDQYWDYFF